MPTRDSEYVHVHRRPTQPQSSLGEQTNDMERALEMAIAKAGQNFHLQVQRALSLQQSQSMEWANKATRWWKAIAAVGLAASITMGTMMASCMNAYQAARVDAVEPAARAEEKAADANERVDEHADRLNRIETVQKELAGTVEKLTGAVIALTSKVGGPDSSRIDVPATTAKPRRGPR